MHAWLSSFVNYKCLILKGIFSVPLSVKRVNHFNFLREEAPKAT